MKIKSWYDRHTRSWVVQVIDELGNEVDCAYSGCKETRDADIEFFKSEYEVA